MMDADDGYILWTGIWKGWWNFPDLPDFFFSFALLPVTDSHRSSSALGNSKGNTQLDRDRDRDHGHVREDRSNPAQREERTKYSRVQPSASVPILLGRGSHAESGNTQARRRTHGYGHGHGHGHRHERGRA